MPELPVESGPANQVVTSLLDGALRRLWERARQISELVEQLRTENKRLTSRIDQLEGNERHLQRQAEDSAAALADAQSQLRQLQARNGGTLYSKEEQERVVATIKDLIQKLDSRL